MRTPDRFEKHNGIWWVFCEPYTVDGRTEYAMGGWDTRKDAETSWSSYVKCMRRQPGSSNYGREIHEVPTSYIPREEPNSHQGERSKRWRRGVATGKQAEASVLISGSVVDPPVPAEDADGPASDSVVCDEAEGDQRDDGWNDRLPDQANCKIIDLNKRIVVI